MNSNSNNNVTVNVNALSNALAVAIQQAFSSSGTNSQAPPPVSMLPTTTESRSRQVMSAREVLPSFLKKRRSCVVDSAIKKKRVTQVWDRDIVCLPKTHQKPMPYPRGKYRERLGRLGLIGKIQISSDMTIEEVEDEIRSVFKEPMGNTDHFSFIYLQPTGCGSRSLTIPSVSSTFNWTAQQVAKLGCNKGTVYIMAQDDLNIKSEGDSSDSEDCKEDKHAVSNKKTEDNSVQLEDPSFIPPFRSDATKSPVLTNQSASSYSTYVDLTVHSEDEIESDNENLPPVCFPLLSRPHNKVKPDIIKMKHILIQHVHKVIAADHEEDFQRINIRKFLFSDALRGFSKPTFDVSKMLKVTFIGEAAVDDGGPRREFLSYLMKDALKSSGLFIGWPSNVIPIHNIEALCKRKFYTIGSMIATSLIQGGEPPACLAHPVADFLIYNTTKCQPCIDDIPDIEIREKLKQVSTATSNEELQKLFVNEDFDFRVQCGYSKPIATIFDNKDGFINTIWQHYVLFSIHSELQQLQNGFYDTLDMRTLVGLYPNEMHSLLMSSPSLEINQEFFVNEVIVLYSDEASNKRTAEEAIMLYWSEYIMECSGEHQISLSDVLQFLTGCSRIPAVGFEGALCIQFTDEDRLPSASTCTLTIIFSRSISEKSYEDFKVMMDECILCTCGFRTP